MTQTDDQLMAALREYRKQAVEAMKRMESRAYNEESVKHWVHEHGFIVGFTHALALLGRHDLLERSEP